jgi:hypothetical protein
MAAYDFIVAGAAISIFWENAGVARSNSDPDRVYSATGSKLARGQS